MTSALLFDAGLAPLEGETGPSVGASGEVRSSHDRAGADARTEGPPSDVIRARAYTHPAVSDRSVTLLVGDAIALGQDEAMAQLGFDAPTASAPLARGPRRALGYPAWALVFDPADARAALAALTPMRRAARLAATKPGRAEKEYETIAAGLPVSHLPAFWDQAARDAHAAGAERLALAAFKRARKAQGAAAPVDCEAVEEAYLEFVAGGVFSVEIMTDFPSLFAPLDPADLYSLYRRVAMRLVLGGVPPWVGIVPSLGKAAKAAGLDRRAEERELVPVLATAPASARATGTTWSDWAPALADVCPADPALRAYLLSVFPRRMRTAHWIELLDFTGAIDDLIAGRGDIATWVSAAIAYAARPDADLGIDNFGPLIGLLPRLGPAAVDQGRDVAYPLDWVDAGLLDVLIGAGFQVTGVPASGPVQLVSALPDAAASTLAALAGSPLAEVIDRGIADAEDLDPLLALPAIRNRIGAHVAVLVDLLPVDPAAAVAGLDACGPGVWHAFPDIVARFEVDLAPALAAGFRQWAAEEPEYERFAGFDASQAAAWLAAARTGLASLPDPSDENAAAGAVLAALSRLGARRRLLRGPVGGVTFESTDMARNVADSLIGALALEDHARQIAGRAGLRAASLLIPRSLMIPDGPLAIGLSEDLGLWKTQSRVRMLVAASEYFAGRASAIEVVDPKAASYASDCDWTSILTRPGLAAVRLMSPGMAFEARRALARFLRLYSDTKYPDLIEEGVLRRGALIADERRVDVFDDPAGRAVIVAPALWEGGVYRHPFLEVGPGGAMEKAGRVQDVRLIHAPWGDRDQIAQVLRMASRGPLAWDDAARDLLASRTGLAKPAATLLLAGDVCPESSTADFDRAVMRRATGLTETQLPRAAKTLEAFDTDKRLAVIAAGAAGLTSGPHAGTMLGVAEAMADAWEASFGGSGPDPATIVAVPFDWPTGRETSVVFEDLLRPAGNKAMANPPRGLAPGWKAIELFADALAESRLAIAWCCQTLPMSHPILDHVGEAYASVRRALDEPELLLPLATCHVGPVDLPHMVDQAVAEFPKRYRGKVPDDWRAYDDGLTVLMAGKWTGSGALSHYVRAAAPESDLRWPAAWARVASDRFRKFTAVQTASALRSDGFAALVERIGEARAAGLTGYEADPAQSAPALLAEAATRLGLGEEAARYYLQLLALADPTDANVKKWNGWTPKTLAAARSALIEAGLVVPDKRSRAGRTAFAPGDWWNADWPALPVEAAKASWLDLSLVGGKATSWSPVFLPSRPLGQVFETAWNEGETR